MLSTTARLPLSRAALTTIVLAGSALLVGGCNDSLKTENQRLTEEKTQLTATSQQQADEIKALRTQMSDLSRQVAEANAKSAAAANPPANPASDSGRPARPTGDTTQVVLEVAGDVLFASGSTAIKPEGKKELDGIAAALKGRYAGRSVRIEGYTDSDPIRKSSFSTNEALGKARADEVEKYLISRGVPPERMTTVGMGAAKPRATKAASRRVEIVVLGG